MNLSNRSSLEVHAVISRSAVFTEDTTVLVAGFHAASVEIDSAMGILKDGMGSAPRGFWRSNSRLQTKVCILQYDVREPADVCPQECGRIPRCLLERHAARQLPPARGRAL